MKIKFVILILLLAATISLSAQCPFGNGIKVNCIHGCGRFIDQNNDGFCDNGAIEQSVETPKDTAKIVKDSAKTEPQKTNTKTDVPQTRQTFKLRKQSLNSLKVKQPETQSPVIEISKDNKQTSFRYPVILISCSVLVLYILTMVLVKKGNIKKITHRRIWNIFLLISFMLSCIGGFYLVLQLNYGWTLSFFPCLLKIHVWAGIIMALIGFIHILWHLTYFKRILKPNRDTK